MRGFFKLVITTMMIACSLTLFTPFSALLLAGESDAILAGAQKEG